MDRRTRRRAWAAPFHLVTVSAETAGPHAPYVAQHARDQSLEGANGEKEKEEGPGRASVVGASADGS